MFEMEAVELSLPVAAAAEVSKILSVEGFSREGISAGGAEHRGSLRAKDPVFGRFPLPSRFSSSDATCRESTSEQVQVLRTKKADAGLCMFHNSLPSYVDETTSPQDGKLLFSDKQLQRKLGKSPKNSSFGSKRPRSEYIQGSISQVGLPGDCNVLTGKQKSSLAECTFAERSPAFGQKHNIDGKRGDKRHFKPPTKPKVDSVFSKGGLVSCSSSPGGGSILGVYGLKSDIHDVTKHVDEVSLNDLLDGSYKYPPLYQHKVKKATNTNEVLVHTIKRACSVLQPWKPSHAQNSPELDTAPNKGDKEPDLASSNKDSCIESTTSSTCQPKDILERLALPPSKSLDALLHDTSKSNYTNNLRLTKPMSYGPSLPPFPWSNSSNAPSRSSTETGKLFCNRSRWVTIGSIVSNSPSSLDPDITNLDQKVSIKGADESDWKLKLGLPPGNSVKAEQSQRQSDGGHSPRLLAAAQTLYGLRRYSSEENPRVRWPKKQPSQKSMKARKLIPEKTEVLSSMSRLRLGHDVSVKTMEKTLLPLKKSKYLINDKWCVPTSSRSENVEAKKHLMPPFKRGLDWGRGRSNSKNEG